MRQQHTLETAIADIVKQFDGQLTDLISVRELIGRLSRDDDDHGVFRALNLALQHIVVDFEETTSDLQAVMKAEAAKAA